MSTTTRTVRIRLDQAVEIEKRNINLSEFLRDKLDEELGSTDFIKNKEKELKEELKKIKNIKKIAKKEAKKEEISAEKDKFIQEAREIIKRNPEFLRGQWSRYKNIFGNITLEKFQGLINKNTLKEKK